MRRSRSIWVSTAVAVVLLAIVPIAAALPGDPPVTAIAPADGATVEANPAGIPVSFGCPEYRKDVYGEAENPIIDRGNFEDYDVTFSPSPSLDPRGVLAGAYPSASPILRADGSNCTTTLDTEDSATSPEAVGGRVYWQVRRSCVGCGGSQIEAGPVRSFVVKAAPIASRVTTPSRVYAGYLTRVELLSTAKVGGATAMLQRRVGKKWQTIATEKFFDSATFFVKLPGGSQQLRGVIATAGGSSPGKPRTVVVRPDRGRTTSARDDGRYEQVDGGKVSFTVGGGGRTLRNFSASVSALCFGATVEENHFMILFAGIDTASIAPDGSVTGRLETKSGETEAELSGRLRGGRFVGEASISIEPSRCSGTRKLEARRR